MLSYFESWSNRSKYLVPKGGLKHQKYSDSHLCGRSKIFCGFKKLTGLFFCVHIQSSNVFVAKRTEKSETILNKTPVTK